MRANYGHGKAIETFREAMKAEGYNGISFCDPKGMLSTAGYWRDDLFQLDEADTNNAELETAMDGLPAGTSIGNAAFCFDLHCKRTPIGSDSSELVPWLEKERKTVGFVRLVSRLDTSKKVWLVVAHLMTTSRDSPKTNWCVLSFERFRSCSVCATCI
jgi:hypothetical protein